MDNSTIPDHIQDTRPNPQQSVSKLMHSTDAPEAISGSSRISRTSGKGRKVCPNCKAAVGSPTKICGKCQHKFVIKSIGKAAHSSKVKKNTPSIGKGRKLCIVCNGKIKSATKQCPHCGSKVAKKSTDPMKMKKLCATGTSPIDELGGSIDLEFCDKSKGRVGQRKRSNYSKPSMDGEDPTDHSAHREGPKQTWSALLFSKNMGTRVHDKMKDLVSGMRAEAPEFNSATEYFSVDVNQPLINVSYAAIAGGFPDAATADISSSVYPRESYPQLNVGPSTGCGEEQSLNPIDSVNTILTSGILENGSAFPPALKADS